MMMGASNISKRGKKAQKTLALLKKAAVTIAIFDLILTISDCRNVGRFFLLLTMSSTFDITPENVIEDHCSSSHNLRRGICETYATMMESGTLFPFPSDLPGRNQLKFHTSTFSSSTPNQQHNVNINANVNADTEEEESYLRATLSIQRLPEMFKELVTSWKSKFDPSRTETNISFYFDDDDEIPQMQEKRKQQPPKPEQHQHSHSTAEAAGFSQSVPVSSTSLKNPSPSSLKTTRDGKNIPTLNQKRASTTTTTFGESHEYLQQQPQPHLNSLTAMTEIRDHDEDFIPKTNSFLPHDHDHDTTLPFNDVTSLQQKKDGDDYENNDISYNHGHEQEQEIDSNRKKRFTQPLQQQQESIGQTRSIREKEELGKNIQISQSNNNKDASIQEISSFTRSSSSTIGENVDNTFSSTTSKTTLEKITLESGSTIVPSPPSSQTNSYSDLHLAPSPSSFTGTGKSDHLKPSKLLEPSVSGGGGEKFNETTTVGGLRQKRKAAPFEESSFSSEPNQGEKCSQSPGPKKMIGFFLQQELFSRWQSLVETAGALLINPGGQRRNAAACIGEQLGSPEAGRIKMHIELKPFGPKLVQEAERRVKATQQILFDSPWLTLIQLYSKLSGSFIKMFVVVSVYTWVWGTVLGILLLIGSLTEEPVMIHCWIIFNILYSLLFFMIDDWIHSNVNPCRSTVSIWLSISYSLYKPLATWVVLMQWSEMKKLVQPTEKTGGDENSTSTSSSSVSNDGSSPCLNKNTIKGSTPHNSNPSLSSTASDTTKESTIVDISDLHAITTTADIGPLYPIEKESNTAAALMLAVSTLRSSAADNSIKAKLNTDFGHNFIGGVVREDEEDEDDDDDDEGDDDDDDDDTEGEERERAGDLEKGNESEANNAINTTTTTITSLKHRDTCGERESSKSGSVMIAKSLRSNGYVVTH